MPTEFEDIVEYDADPTEWDRRYQRFDSFWTDLYRLAEQDLDAVNSPVWHIRASNHGSIYSLKYENPCTCWIGAACTGKNGYHKASRTDIDGPHADRADAWLYAGLSTDSNDKIFQRWIELGRPHEHWERWFRSNPKPWIHVDDEDEEWNDQVEAGEQEWDEMRAQQRRAGVL